MDNPSTLHQEMPSTSSVTETVDGAESNQTLVLRLQLQKPKNPKKVAWNSNTVDNEHMGKKKSKCCCIYKKPTVFGESSSESEDECENCFGHPEKRKKNKPHGHTNGECPHNHDESDSKPIKEE